MVMLVLALGVGTAGATTICVPTYSAACPNNGSNVAEPDLEKAMGTDGWDGEADEIFIAAGTFTEDAAFEPASGFKNADSFEPEGSDELTITGAGEAATYITSNGTANIFLVNLGAGGNVRDIAMRDLTIQIPVSFPDGLGAGILLTGDALEGVTVESQNKGSDGAIASGVGSVARDVEVEPGGIGGAIAVAFATSTPEGGTFLVEDSTIVNASWNVAARAKGSQLTARRISATGTTAYGAAATAGTLRIENSVITMADGVGLYVSAAEDNANLKANHVTIVNTEGIEPALEGRKFDTDEGDAVLQVSNSILRGFSPGYELYTPGGEGTVLIEGRYTNMPLNGNNHFGTVNLFVGNSNADPLLGPDYTLTPGSPAIDAGDPGPGGLTTDFLGAPRPNDGNGDGYVISDQGAFEYQRPPDPPNPPKGGGPTPDVTAPQTTIAKGPGAKLAKGKAKFSFRSSESGSRFECKLDRRKVRPCISPKRYTGLKPGRHTFKVWAIDAAGNKDPSPAKRSFRVPG
ncbi:MAG: hypothetical protein M3335_03300 [Actinomycetota bacterium]|nr:hypothetical protein [Actinomycetota bacterium]